MGTRLLSESIVKRHFPQLRYVRIHSNGKHAAVIYAWNEQLRLPAKDEAELARFASSHLLPYVCFKVKPYSMVQDDRVPVAGDLPDIVVQAAMNRELDQHRIAAVLSGMLAGGSMHFTRYEVATGTIHFDVRTASTITDIEKELIGKYLNELIPLGSNHKITYRQFIRS
ncbi:MULTISPECIES: hypothetical protein [Cohnella]|uniref:hypothetical protein n=1 Tax=Cohnella TaxID=329857 RepID=UPI001593A848|nr:MULTISPECIES: hypothetical protein [Cohnella]MBN2983155.1 hypothetical protein [Cohnella algarum]